MRKSFLALLILGLMTGCDQNDAQVASHNLSQDADNFKINRRVVFVNGFTDNYLFLVEGLCSIASGTSSKSITVTCKVGADSYKKHILGLSDNITYFVEQLEPAQVGVYHYKVTFKPSVILPSVEIR